MQAWPLYCANIYNVDLILIDYLSIILTATLASVGTAGVPGWNNVRYGTNKVGLPLEVPLSLGLIDYLIC